MNGFNESKHASTHAHQDSWNLYLDEPVWKIATFFKVKEHTEFDFKKDWTLEHIFEGIVSIASWNFIKLQV